MSTKTKQTTPDKSPASQGKKQDQAFAFNKQNYQLTIASVVIIFLGFYLMAGKEDIFSTTKLTVAPIVIVIGFVVGIFAIMKKPKD